MRTIEYPSRELWDELLKRPALNLSGLYDRVQKILDKVKEGHDMSVLEYEERFDGVRMNSLAVTEEEIADAKESVSRELKEAIRKAADNIAAFHKAQLPAPVKVETTPGVVCWQKAVPIQKVGLYIPGGTAPLFSTVLMLAIPAKIAGCRDIVLCTPPDKNGHINPTILYAARAAGVDRIFKAGGAQAVAAMAYGTESIPKVSKIFGPGNPYVTAAKQLVSLRDVAIDMPAGPSEVLVIADESASPRFVAADLLSQAEHGRDSQVILATTSGELLREVQNQIDIQLAALPRKEIAAEALENSRLILLGNMDDVIDLANTYAPEHLIIQAADYMSIAGRILNAGSVFLGSYSPESAGDYASGTNHTLPTSGYATAYSGVNIDSFMRKMTFQELTHDGLKQLGPVIQTMAQGESLDAHCNAVTVRLEKR